jgi:hypothetical protein
LIRPLNLFGVLPACFITKKPLLLDPPALSARNRAPEQMTPQLTGHASPPEVSKTRREKEQITDEDAWLGSRF